MLTVRAERYRNSLCHSILLPAIQKSFEVRLGMLWHLNANYRHKQGGQKARTAFYKPEPLGDIVLWRWDTRISQATVLAVTSVSPSCLLWPRSRTVPECLLELLKVWVTFHLPFLFWKHCRATVRSSPFRSTNFQNIFWCWASMKLSLFPLTGDRSHVALKINVS
jgi:hypothetical protein